MYQGPSCGLWYVTAHPSVPFSDVSHQGHAMTTSTRRFLLAATAGALALSGTACDAVGDQIAEEAAEQIAEQAGGEGVDIEVDEDGGQISIESSEGTLDIGGGELPDAFPEGVPLPDGHEVASSMTQGSDGAQSVFVTVSAPGTHDELVSSLESGLTDAGWTIDDTAQMSSNDFASTTFSVSRDDWTGSISVTQVEEGSQVAYVLEQGGA